MILFLSILHFIVCLFLIVVILLQAGKGQGLTGGSFGADNSNSLLGSKTTSFISKLTTFSAIAFIVTSLTLAIFSSQQSQSLMMGDLEKIQNELKDKLSELPDGKNVTVKKIENNDLESVAKKVANEK